MEMDTFFLHGHFEVKGHYHLVISATRHFAVTGLITSICLCQPSPLRRLLNLCTLVFLRHSGDTS